MPGVKAVIIDKSWVVVGHIRQLAAGDSIELKWEVTWGKTITNDEKMTYGGTGKLTWGMLELGGNISHDSGTSTAIAAGGSKGITVQLSAPKDYDADVWGVQLQFHIDFRYKYLGRPVHSTVGPYYLNEPYYVKYLKKPMVIGTHAK